MAANNQFSFCVAGCLHFGATLRLWNSYKDTYQIMCDMAKLKPDMLFINGSDVDLAQRVSDTISFKDDNRKIISGDVQSYKFVDYTRSVLDTLTSEVCDLVFHLLSENSIPEFWGRESPLYKNAETAFLKRTNNQRYYAFQQFEAMFICLDSESHPEHRGRLDKKQLAFLKQLVPEAQKFFKHVFCFIHLSAWRNNEKETSRWFEEVHPILKEANVKYVFGACLHTYQHEIYDGIHYITSGSCGNNVEPSFPHFLKIDVNQDEVTVRVYRKGFPLYFPMDMQLTPQVEAAFINKMPLADTTLNKTDREAYNQAIRLLLSGNVQDAQVIWSQFKDFPDFNPDRIPHSICEDKDTLKYNQWSVNPKIRDQIAARFFK